MSRWITCLAAAALVLIAGCGGPATQPTAMPATTAPAPTSAPSTPAVAPSATVAATATSEPAVAATVAVTSEPANGPDFAPKVRSVWNTAVGLDNMSGTCPKGSLLPVYGLVQITPAENGGQLSWKNQEPAPYTFVRQQINHYQYAGPTALKDGVVTMTLAFKSEKDLEMTRQFVADADPGCLHTHVYTGTFQWEKP
jgi:hypothetical protein